MICLNEIKFVWFSNKISLDQTNIHCDSVWLHLKHWTERVKSEMIKNDETKTQWKIYCKYAYLKEK